MKLIRLTIFALSLFSCASLFAETIGRNSLSADSNSLASQADASTPLSDRKLVAGVDLQSVPNEDIAGSDFLAIQSSTLSSGFLSGVEGQSVPTRQSVPNEDEVQDTLRLNLQSAIEIALSESPIVAVADMEIKKKRYVKRGAQGALFPQIDAFGQYSRTIKKQTMYLDGEFPIGGHNIDPSTLPPHVAEILETLGFLGGNDNKDEGIQFGRSNLWTAGVSINMPLVAPVLWKTIGLTSLDVEMAVEEARESRILLIDGVKRSYYTVLLGEDSYRVYKDMYDNEKENLKDIEQKYKEGIVAEFDVVTAQVRLQTIRPEMIQAKNALEMAKMQLKAMMGISLDLPLKIEERLSDYQENMFEPLLRFGIMTGGENGAMHSDTTTPPAVTPDYNGSVSSEQNDTLSPSAMLSNNLSNHQSVELIANNSQLRKMDLQATQLHKLYEIKVAQFLPKLMASFKYNYLNQSNDFKFHNYSWDPFSTTDITLSIPIFSGGTRYNELKAAKISEDQISEQRIDVERKILLEVKNKMSQIAKSIEQIQALKSTEEQAQRGYTIALKRYETGMGTLLEVNHASLAIANVRLQKNNATYVYLTAKSELEKLLGQNDLLED